MQFKASLYRTVQLRIAAFFITILMGVGVGHAQVSGISYSFSPIGEYTLWDNNAGITDGYGFGGSMGIGFGQYLELHGTYLRSLDMRNDFSRFTIPDPPLAQPTILVPERHLSNTRT